MEKPTHQVLPFTFSDNKILEKSCLIASLLGDEFEEKISTQGADVDVCKIFASKWSRLKKGEVSKVLQEKYYGKLKVTAQIKISAEQQQPVLKAQNRQQLLESLPELPKAVQADLEQAKTAVLIDDDGINAIILGLCWSVCVLRFALNVPQRGQCSHDRF